MNKVLKSLGLVITVLATITSTALANTSQQKNDAYYINLIQEAKTTNCFADYNNALVEINSLSKEKQDRFLNELAPMFNNIKNVQVIMDILNKMQVFAKTGKGEMYDAMVNIEIPNANIEEKDKAYLSSELYGWGLEMLKAQPGYAKSMDAIIEAWKLYGQANKEGAKASIEKAKIAIELLTNEENKKYLSKQLKEIEDKLTIDNTNNTTVPVENGTPFKVGNNTIILEDTKDNIIAKYGQPNRIDQSNYEGMNWYIYNNDYSKYFQVGIKDDKVVAVYSNAPNVEFNEMKSGYIKDDQPIPQIDNYNTVIYYDIHEGNSVTSILVKAKSLKRLASITDEIIYGYERQIFDLSNVARVKRERSTLKWDDKAATSARKHSVDMAQNNYFAHNSQDGTTPFDRMKAEGISYMTAGENIAAGQRDAIDAYEGWMNSLGHRKNILNPDFERLGVGVALGGSFGFYYTQNFYTAK
jgi:uncharacterized protein YkwD